MDEHVGHILISQELLFKWLDFDGAKLRQASVDQYLNLDLIIEHPEMPLIEQGCSIPVVSPSYIAEEDGKNKRVKEK